jgi:hypothetical protein
MNNVRLKVHLSFMRAYGRDFTNREVHLKITEKIKNPVWRVAFINTRMVIEDQMYEECVR